MADFCYTMTKGEMPVIDILVESGAVASKREAARLLDNDAIEVFSWKPLKEPHERWGNLRFWMAADAAPAKFRVGKHRWLTVLPFKEASDE